MQTIYLVPHTHYDVVWAFTKEEYLKINEAVLEEALRLMEPSEFKFCLEQTFLLKEMEKRNPDVIGNDYLAIGVVDREDWRRGSKGELTQNQLIERMYVFKDVWVFEPLAPRWRSCR